MFIENNFTVLFSFCRKICLIFICSSFTSFIWKVFLCFFCHVITMMFLLQTVFCTFLLQQNRKMNLFSITFESIVWMSIWLWAKKELFCFAVFWCNSFHWGSWLWHIKNSTGINSNIGHLENKYSVYREWMHLNQLILLIWLNYIQFKFNRVSSCAKNFECYTIYDNEAWFFMLKNSWGKITVFSIFSLKT